LQSVTSESFVGYQPEILIRSLEQQKYEQVWSHPEYRVVAPGEDSTVTFLAQSKAEKGHTVIDFGCGTGRGAQSLKDAGLKVTAVDFAKNCLDPQVDVDFVQADLTKTIPVSAEFGYCTDVMEHLPTEDVHKVIQNILSSASKVFFQIACVDDVMGVLVGAPLHLTVKPYSWWKEVLEKHGKIIWSEDQVHTCQFYVRSKVLEPVDEVKTSTQVNIEEEQLKENIRTNIQAGWKLIGPYEKQDVEVMLIGGGPSLNDFAEEIEQKRKDGVALITTNGAYHWAIERDLKPSAQVVVDGREFNKRFLSPVIEGCKYLVASQCDPVALECLPKDQTFLWHAISDPETVKLIEEAQESRAWPIPGGSTVMLRAIMLLQTLGFYKIHIYGMDSCIGETHHAYAQQENDKDKEITVKVKTKTKEFVCAPWMALQAKEFRQMAGQLDDEVDLAVYGDGLIATMIRESADD
jgi:SAM-dependent methyltransferase